VLHPAPTIFSRARRGRFASSSRLDAPEAAGARTCLIGGDQLAICDEDHQASSAEIGIALAPADGRNPDQL